MDGENIKIVEYDKYCNTCIHEKLKEDEDPCHDCLNEPGRLYSHKPSKYEKKPEHQLRKKELVIVEE